MMPIEGNACLVNKDIGERRSGPKMPYILVHFFEPRFLIF